MDKVFTSFLIDLFCEICTNKLEIEIRDLTERLLHLPDLHPANRYRKNFESIKLIFINGKVDYVFNLHHKKISVVSDETLLEAKRQNIITHFDYLKIT